MFRSRLSIRISISELVETLSENECVNVIRLLQHELGYTSLNTMVNKIMFQLTQTVTNESLINMEQTIKDTSSAHPTPNPIISAINNTSQDNVLFPLHRLPNDLILKTSLFLNDKDIFKFEQCCRLFYKMTNNTSYLTHCHNFKEFIITKKRLEQMKQPTYNFFKYSKTNQLAVNLHPRCWKGGLHAALNDFETTMNTMKLVERYDNYNWWISLCKSISILDLDSYTDMGILLSRMPIDILFNPKESNLKSIKLCHYGKNMYPNAWNNDMNKFEQDYLDCKKKWENQGLKIKSLDCMVHKMRILGTAAMTSPRYIVSKHVWMQLTTVDLTDDKFLTNECNPGMKILTIEQEVRFITNNDSRSIITNRGLQIETMRWLWCWNWVHLGICSEKVVILSLNLQITLKNLTIEFPLRHSDGYDNQKTVLENVFRKKYYHNLENVNIIVDIPENESIDWLFNLLKENQKILKYQFRHLNIAMVKNVEYPRKVYFVLEWNKNVDDKHLNQAKKQFDKIKRDDPDQQQFKEKCLLMRTQWLD